MSATTSARVVFEAIGAAGAFVIAAFVPDIAYDHMKGAVSGIIERNCLSLT